LACWPLTKSLPPRRPRTHRPKPAYTLPDPVAVVEGATISSADLEKAFKNVLAQQKVEPATVSDDQRIRGYHIVLDDMIIDKLVAKRAAGVKVPDDEVNAQWERIKGNFGSEAELKKQVEAAGETLDKVKQGLRDRIQQEHWIDAQVGDKAKVTDADAEDFYKKNPDQFKEPEQVRASHILVKVEQDAKPEVVVQKQKAAQAIADRVKKGEDFAKVAKELSDDPGSKEKGGDLNFFQHDAMVKEFADAAFAMKKDEISDPVRSEFGYHIIKVTDRKSAGTVSLDQVKPQLVAFLQKKKKQTEIEKLVEDIRAKADVKVNLPEAPAPAAPASAPAPAPQPAPAR
jgi:peptidyl-prolyl cis-trans isomerase C